MFSFTALIYDGYKQQLVRGDYEDKTQFEAYLDAKFGVYVCMWSTQDPTQEVLKAMFNASDKIE